jgi:hypothetical protein
VRRGEQVDGEEHARCGRKRNENGGDRQPLETMERVEISKGWNAWGKVGEL